MACVLLIPSLSVVVTFKQVRHRLELLLLHCIKKCIFLNVITHQLATNATTTTTTPRWQAQNPRVCTLWFTWQVV